MYIDDFATNLGKIQKTIFNSEFSQHLQTYNFDSQTLSEVLVSMLAESMKTALSLKEQDIKEREIALNEEKIRQEIEISSNASNINNKINLAESLKSLIQAEAMLKSVNDNALINRANASVAFLSTVGNAEQTSAIATHAPAVIRNIDSIVTKDLSSYENLLNDLKTKITKDIQQNNQTKQVFIYSPKLTIKSKERVRIFGFSTFGNNEVKFIVGGIESNTRTYDFYSEVEGRFDVRFLAKDYSNNWIEDRIVIEVKGE